MKIVEAFGAVYNDLYIAERYARKYKCIPEFVAELRILQNSISITIMGLEETENKPNGT